MDKLANLTRSVDMCCFLEFGDAKESCKGMSHIKPGIGEDYSGLHRNIPLFSEKSNTIIQLSIYCAWFTKHNYQE